ncbi:glycosyltransferase [Candidatus Dependentiae bacterium]|nr:glycosyltransferase [Candidatus Dependentiae bacterium]
MKKNQPHILYVLTKLELGGAQKVCLTLLKGITNHNITSSLLSGTEGPLVEQAKKHDSVFLLKSLKREVGIKTIFYEFLAFIQMITHMRKLKKNHPNVIVHTHSTKAGLMGRWAAFFARIKKRVHTVHGFGFHDHQSRIGWYANMILEYITSLITTHYVCVSRCDQNIGNTYFPWFSKKSSVIRAAVDWNRFYQPAKQTKSDKIIFGTVSCLKPQKNIIDLLKAYKYVCDNLSQDNQNRIHLQIIGDGIQRPLIESWLAKNNLLNKVDLLGWQHNVDQWMRSWDLFVMSSLWEGLPCAIVEARLNNLPVIAYNIAGIPEIIADKKNGFLVPAGNWKLLGNRMKNLVENHTLLQTLSFYNDHLEDFQNSTMIKKHSELYSRMNTAPRNK